MTIEHDWLEADRIPELYECRVVGYGGMGELKPTSSCHAKGKTFNNPWYATKGYAP